MGDVRVYITQVDIADDNGPILQETIAAHCVKAACGTAAIHLLSVDVQPHIGFGEGGELHCFIWDDQPCLQRQLVDQSLLQDGHVRKMVAGTFERQQN